MFLQHRNELKKMNLFINDLPIRIHKDGRQPESKKFAHIIDAKNDKITAGGRLYGSVWANR